MNIIFLGAPGTGKGTIAARLASGHGFTHIAPGNIFREEVKKGSEIGKKVKELIDKGILVPYELTNRLVKQRISKNNVFDGYPRTLEQAESLDAYLTVDITILFNMSEQQIIERLSGRRTCPQCQAVYHIKNVPPKKPGICDHDGTPLVQREDDKPEVIKKRFRVYDEQTAPLIDLYKKRGILKTIDASGTPDEVYILVKKLLKMK